MLTGSRYLDFSKYIVDVMYHHSIKNVARNKWDSANEIQTFCIHCSIRRCDKKKSSWILLVCLIETTSQLVIFTHHIKTGPCGTTGFRVHQGFREGSVVLDFFKKKCNLFYFLHVSALFCRHWNDFDPGFVSQIYYWNLDSKKSLFYLVKMLYWNSYSHRKTSM